MKMATMQILLVKPYVDPSSHVRSILPLFTEWTMLPAVGVSSCFSLDPGFNMHLGSLETLVDDPSPVCVSV